MRGGERFNISESVPGLNFPPMHPWCRCFFDPVIPEKIGEKSLTSGADSGIIEEIKKTGIKFQEIHIPPQEIDVSLLTLDAHHIESRKHGVSMEEAVSFVEDAEASVSRWGGQFENYYSKSGAAYIDVKANVIRTAFRSDEYDDRIKEMMEVLEKWKQLTSYMGDTCVAIDHETARNTYFATGEAPIMYLQFAEITMLEKVIPEGFEYGFFNFPAFEDGKGDPEGLTGAPEGFMISNKAKNPEECVKFLKWLVSKKGGEALTTKSGEISSVAGAVDETNALPAQLEAMEIIKSASTLVPWFDNACDASVYTVYGQGAQAIASGDETPESVMEQVKEAAAALH